MECKRVYSSVPKKAVLISSNYKAICCYSCCLSLGKQADREICTTERQLNCLGNMHFLFKWMGTSINSCTTAFLPGEPGSDSHPLASDVPLCTLSVLSKVKTWIYISSEKLSMGYSCRIFQEIT